jgi:S-adenosylmethionine hydrolase
VFVLVTDFGLEGPYTGQVKAVLAEAAPGVPILDLFADLPPFRADLAAYLLAAYAPAFPERAIFVCVVDPGVGTGRGAVLVEADGRRFVGPDNGMLAIVYRRATRRRSFQLPQPGHTLSASFHGRDLFAPVAADLAMGRAVKGAPAPLAVGDDLPDDLPRIVYVDRYGNAMTGLRAEVLGSERLRVAGQLLERRRTFGDVPPGVAFWYPNANGLAEIAANQARAADLLGLGPGAPVERVPD